MVANDLIHQRVELGPDVIGVATINTAPTSGR
jgi:hypothetical protein